MSESAGGLPLVTGGDKSWLQDESGRAYLDLSMGYGSVWLGHNHPEVVAAVKAQLDGHAAPGFFPTRVLERVKTALAEFLPATHVFGGLYSTGMEAVETALRAAWQQTGRLDIAGCEASTHGRSYLTSALGGRGSSGQSPAFVHRLPAFADASADEMSKALERLSNRVALAAVVIEPIQMTGGGHQTGPAFYEALFSFARERGFAVVFDETLTGLYRCGKRFYFELTGQLPDVVILGKGLANGLPAACVVLRKEFCWDRGRVKPGSTFWNHPVTCAATAATLDEILRCEPEDKVQRIEQIVRAELADLELNGRGAMWCVGVPRADGMAQFARALLDNGIVVSYYDRYIRLLPSLNIEPGTLAQACRAIRKVYADSFG
ncbi:MAG: aminotransferase class III-fold pyridoxal phosphate-dependent enzyme [Burkholderiales bacterium]